MRAERTLFALAQGQIRRSGVRQSEQSVFPLLKIAEYLISRRLNLWFQLCGVAVDFSHIPYFHRVHVELFSRVSVQLISFADDNRSNK